MFNFGGLIDAFDMLPNDVASDIDMETLTKEINALRKWVEDYFDPDAVAAQGQKEQTGLETIIEAWMASNAPYWKEAAKDLAKLLRVGGSPARSHKEEKP